MAPKLPPPPLMQAKDTILARWCSDLYQQIKAGLIGGSSSPLTTKGGLITHDATADVQLAVGSDGEVLTADSTQPDGIKWAALPAAPVTSVAGKTGVVTLVESDIANLTTDLAAKAPLASPTFTGTPAAPTAAGGTNTTQVATCQFVQSAVVSGGASTPDDVPNLAAWWKADSGVTPSSNGSTITAWTDSNPTTLQQMSVRSGSTGPTYKTNQINSLPAVEFNGTTDVMQLGISGAGPVLWGNELTFFIVAKCTLPSTPAASATLLSGGNGSVSWKTSNVNMQVVDKTFAANIGVSGNASDNSWHIHTFQYGNLGVYIFRTDRTLINSSVNSVSMIAVNNFVGANLGSGTPSEFYKGQVAEIIVYRRSLTKYEVNLIEGYLHSKYGI